MKKLTLFLLGILCPLLGFSQLSWQRGTPPEQNQADTLIFDATGTPLAGTAAALYAHIGVTVNQQPWQAVRGNWGVNSSQPQWIRRGTNRYVLAISPSVEQFFQVTSGTITRINLVVRNAAANAQTADLSIQVGAFDMQLVSVRENGTVLVPDTGVALRATNTGGTANYRLFDPTGLQIDSQFQISSYQFRISNPILGRYRLASTKNNLVISKEFEVVPAIQPMIEPMPTGLEDGVNYSSDSTKVTLVLNAPGKDFVYVAGNFNNWRPNSQYAMRRESATGKYWLEIDSLVPGTWYAFQYWVCDITPLPNAPTVVKSADPFSTLIFSQSDDNEIRQLNTFGPIPAWDVIAPGQERDATAIQTGANAFWQYRWKTTNKPNAVINKRNLRVYELLIRDFDADRTFQDLLDRFSYFKNLKMNAIQLMPIMEFEGNMSWGYNPIYHMALDKRYGSPAKFKEFVDSCHANGIAVILDIALNHVFGRSPLERMWMLDADNNGWSDGISPESPYCNERPRHTLNVGADLNHFREPENLTNTYVQRTIREWIQTYRIDGFRWDLTQGFTNACTENDGGCTGSYQADRVGKLSWYADSQWQLDPNFIVIFEHWVFGEIPYFTNYRLNETPAKGVICWRRADHEFAELLKGNGTNLDLLADATGRIQGNMESHDEEHIVYKAMNEAGQTRGNLTKTLNRMAGLGALTFLVPGPKMFWQFGPLGWSLSINTCPNGNLGNCRIDTKPQPQWTGNWMADQRRLNVYENWAKMLALSTTEPMFNNAQHAFNYERGPGRIRLDVWNSTQPQNQLSYLLVQSNFTNDVLTQPAYFPYTGIWYNMLDNTSINVTNTLQPITIPSDGFVVYGNARNPLLSADQINKSIYTDLFNVKNPIQNDVFEIDFHQETKEVIELTLYSLDGRIISKQELPIGTKNISWQQKIVKGIYLLNARSNTGSETVKVVVE